MLDLRDQSIIDALPHRFDTVIDIGSGEGRVGHYLAQRFYKVTLTDIYKDHRIEEGEYLEFIDMDILDPIGEEWDVVMCAEVLEHIPEWELAYENIIKIAKQRAIITIPYGNSFASPDHINHYVEEDMERFVELASPYCVSYCKIRSKPQDVQLNQWNWLIIVDKKQKYERKF